MQGGFGVTSLKERADVEPGTLWPVLPMLLRAGEGSAERTPGMPSGWAHARLGGRSRAAAGVLRKTLSVSQTGCGFFDGILTTLDVGPDACPMDSAAALISSSVSTSLANLATAASSVLMPSVRLRASTPISRFVCLSARPLASLV
jgi:hypothetical protein